MPYQHHGIAPAPRSPAPYARVVHRLIGRYAAKRAAAGEQLALTGVMLEVRHGGDVGLSVRAVHDALPGRPTAQAAGAIGWFARNTSSGSTRALTARSVA